MKHLFLPLSFLLAVGCHSSDTDRGVTDPSTTEQSAPAAPAATATQDAGSRDPTRSLIIWRWPESSGEQRDLAADHAECLKKADAETKSIRRTGVLWDCMRRKGWQRIKGAELNFDAKKPAAPPQ